MFKLRDYFMQEAGVEEIPGGGGEPAKTYTQAELDEIVSGLKTNNASLLAEKKETARKAQEDQQARILAEQEQAKTTGKLDEFEKSLRKQYDPVIAEKDGKITKMSERILGSERKSVIASLSGMFLEDEAADIIGMMVRTEFDGDDVVTKFVGADGKVITTDVDIFKQYLKDHKAFSHLIKADTPTGGGAGGNKRPTGGAGDVDAIQQKLNAKYNGKKG